jgi:hypothetical protein
LFFSARWFRPKLLLVEVVSDAYFLVSAVLMKLYFALNMNRVSSALATLKQRPVITR